MYMSIKCCSLNHPSGFYPLLVAAIHSTEATQEGPLMNGCCDSLKRQSRQPFLRVLMTLLVEISCESYPKSWYFQNDLILLWYMHFNNESYVYIYIYISIFAKWPANMGFTSRTNKSKTHCKKWWNSMIWNPTSALTSPWRPWREPFLGRGCHKSKVDTWRVVSSKHRSTRPLQSFATDGIMM